MPPGQARACQGDCRRPDTAGERGDLRAQCTDAEQQRACRSDCRARTHPEQIGGDQRIAEHRLQRGARARQCRAGGQCGDQPRHAQGQRKARHLAMPVDQFGQSDGERTLGQTPRGNRQCRSHRDEHQRCGPQAIHCAFAMPRRACGPKSACAVLAARPSPPTSQAHPISRLTEGGRSIQPNGISDSSNNRRRPPPRRWRQNGSAAARAANFRSSVTTTSGSHAASASRDTRFTLAAPVARLVQPAPSRTPVASEPAKPVSKPSAPRA